MLVVLPAFVLWQLYTGWKSGDDTRPALLFGIILVTLVGVPFSISTTVFPFFDIRYVILGLVAVWILVAKSVTDIGSSTIRYATLGIIVLIALSTLPMFYGTATAEPWNEATSTIETEGDEQLVVTVPGYTERMINYYAEEDSSIETIHYSPGDRLGEQIAAYDPDSVWAIVRTRGPGREEIQWSMPDSYEQASNASLGRLELVRYEPNVTATAPTNTTEVAP